MKKFIVIIFLLGLNFIFADDCIEFTPLKTVNKFILVVDRSGSMSGEAIEQARFAIKNFIKDMHSNDEAAIIAFDDKIDVLCNGTTDKSHLEDLVNKLTARGGTHLYDALGKASILAHRTSNQKIIIFLTDGHDGGSNLNISNLNNINLSEGIYVFGIGLGDVNQEALEEIAEKTGGKFGYTPNSQELSNIYSTVLNNYYQNIGNKLSKESKLIISSIPSNQAVYINGEKLKFKTPAVVNHLKPGDYNIVVNFPRGEWKCSSHIDAGKTGLIKARQSELGRDLAIVSDIKSALVFLDDAFIGYTSNYPVTTKTVKTGFFKAEEIPNLSKQLIIKNVPLGEHKIKLVGYPEMQGFFQPLAMSFKIEKLNGFIEAKFLNTKIQFKETDQVLIQKKSKSPFDMDDMFDELD